MQTNEEKLMSAYVHALTATMTTCVCSHACPLQQVFLTLKQGDTTRNRPFHVDSRQGRTGKTSTTSKTDISSTSARFEVTTRSRLPTNKEIDHIARFVLVTFGKVHADLLCAVPSTPVLSIGNLAAMNTPGSVSKKAWCTMFLKNRTKTGAKNIKQNRGCYRYHKKSISP